jgi:DNA-binding transcriptional regulator GbsR (MarR family)
MKKVKISFPQIVVEQREIEVTEEQYEDLTEHSSDDEKTNFIWSQMTDQEKQWTQGKKWVKNAIYVGYCGVAK